MKRFIYKTTNLVNGMIYIGVHQTEDENDVYFGSGTLLLNALKEYGSENFSREVLEYADSTEELQELERKYVTKEFCRRQDVYNMRAGGSIQDDTTKKIISKKLKNKPKTDIQKKRMSDSHSGKVLSDTTKSRMSASKKNNVYIHHPDFPKYKRVHRDDVEEYLSKGWKLGRV